MSQNNEADYPHSIRRDPGGIRAEHGFLLLFAMALTAAAAFCAVDEYTSVDFTRGIYSILTGLFVVGGCGYLSRSAARQTQGEVKRLHAEIANLRRELHATRPESPQWAPPWGRAAGGNMYVSQASVETVPLQSPIAPDAAAALQRIGLRLLPGGDK